MKSILPSRRKLLAIGLAGIVAMAAFSVNRASGWDKSSSKKTASPKRVTLTIDYSDGVQKRFTQLPWQTGMTALDAIELAAKHKRGIKINVRGKKAFALVIGIDNLKNENASGRNWIYQVNGRLATKGIGATGLKPGDHILWAFQHYK